MEELWRDVVGYEKLYQVSNHGRVRSMAGWTRAVGHILKPQLRGKNVEVSLCRRGTQIQKKICFMVLEAFVGPKPEGLQCCHFDDDRWNNYLTNLRWDTQSSNRLDCMRNRPELRGVLSSSAKRRYQKPEERQKTSDAINSSPVWKAYLERRRCRG